MSLVTSIALCAVLVFTVCSCASLQNDKIENEEKKGPFQTLSRKRRQQITSRCGALQPGWQCCDSYQYNPVTELCCNDNPAPKPTGPTVIPACCDQDAYDQTTTLCCDATLVAKPVGVISPACCGSTVYDSNTTLCCSGVVTSRRVPQALCCGTQSYDPVTHLCCQGAPVPKQGGVNSTSLCCGPWAYDVSNSLCCSGFVAYRTALQTHCCGPTSFSPTTQLCCNGVPGLKTGYTSPSCCDSTIYDTLTSLCCDGSFVVLKTPLVSTCNGLN